MNTDRLTEKQAKAALDDIYGLLCDTLITDQDPSHGELRMAGQVALYIIQGMTKEEKGEETVSPSGFIDEGELIEQMGGTERMKELISKAKRMGTTILDADLQKEGEDGR